ncbi:hypothetical protein D3C80_926180 [compost metagenome]
MWLRFQVILNLDLPNWLKVINTIRTTWGFYLVPMSLRIHFLLPMNSLSLKIRMCKTGAYTVLINIQTRTKQRSFNTF